MRKIHIGIGSIDFFISLTERETRKRYLSSAYPRNFYLNRLRTLIHFSEEKYSILYHRNFQFLLWHFVYSLTFMLQNALKLVRSCYFYHDVLEHFWR